MAAPNPNARSTVRKAAKGAVMAGTAAIAAVAAFALVKRRLTEASPREAGE